MTFLFTDIEGSTRLLQRLGDSYSALLAGHHRIIRSAVQAEDGLEVATEGDSFFVVFRSPIEAVGACVAAQRALAQTAWPRDQRVAVRMGVHTGIGVVSDGDYVGLDVNRAARIAAAAHGGQVVLSRATCDLVAGDLPAGVLVRDLGEHRLKDLEQPESLHQLVIDGLPDAFPPLRSLSARFHVLPAEVSTFVGREEEVERIGELLAKARLLTLTGPGGSGKTRLSLQVCRRFEERFDDGVAVVPLAAVPEAWLVPGVIRHALGYAEEVGRSSIEVLTDRLRTADVLLVLDNVEHVLPAATDIASLLAGTERLHVLVTSRAALRLQGEQEYPVPPLSLPLGNASDLDTIASSEAVMLFVERARRARPDFELTDSNAPLIARICARLDGLPLAIELAASRVKVLPPEKLLPRLERSLDLLDSSTPDRDKRQRTLRGAIDWSHELLDQPRRIMFRRLGVFRGGATLEAIEALVPDAGEIDADTLLTLGALVDQSLVRPEGRDDEVRFGMLETIREYALERLAAAHETDAMSRLHAEWYLGHLARVAPAFTAGPAAADSLERDLANVRAAMRWAIDNDETELALRSVGAIWRFWQLRGYLREGRRTAEEFLELAGQDAPHEARARALHALASIRYWQSDRDDALAGYEQALTEARIAEARDIEAEVLYALGYVYSVFKHWDRADAAFTESGALYDALGDRLGSTNARYGRSFAASLEGRWDEAASDLELVVPEFDALGQDFWRFTSRLVLGRTLQRLGRLDRAEELAREGYAGAIELGDGTMRAMALGDLASIAAQRSDHARALRLEGASMALEEQIGGQAPSELINVLDPVALARKSGMADEEVRRLMADGRQLPPDAVAELVKQTPGG